MNHMLLSMKRRYLVFCLLSLFAVDSISAGGGLSGDPEAISRMHRMLESLGGREVWANARSLFTMEKARHPSYGDGIVATFWRDLEHPGERVELQHPDLKVSYAWNESGGWISRGGEVREFIDDEISERTFYWHREIYILYHQLARGERKLHLETLEPNGFRVLNEENKKLADFRLTPDGEVYLWHQHGGKDPVTYVYGPHKSFGATRFLDWGTSVDGRWGFYYVQVLPSTHPFKKHVSMQKPNREWQGGAVNKDCDRNLD